MASAIPSLLVAYGDTGLMGFTSTSQGFFMLGSGPNLNNVSAVNTSVTAYYGLAGSLDSSQSTQANVQVTVNSAFKFSQLTCNVTSSSRVEKMAWIARIPEPTVI
jgi:hypothetical protein